MFIILPQKREDFFMRATWSAVKQLICAAAVFICAAAAFCLTRLPVFAQGKAYELYDSANSSGQSEVTKFPLLHKRALYGRSQGRTRRALPRHPYFLRKRCGRGKLLLLFASFGRSRRFGGQVGQSPYCGECGTDRRGHAAYFRRMLSTAKITEEGIK